MTNSQQGTDHLQIAKAFIAEYGAENLIFADDALWIWTKKGVWQKQDDRFIKKSIQNFLANSQVRVTAPLVGNVVDCLKSEISVPQHTFNVGDPEMVNCTNGQVALVDGAWRLRPHRREDYRTNQIPIAFDDQAKAPRFKQFLNEIFRDDVDKNEKIQALLEMLGYTLMAHARHEKFVILIGAGANGKSVVLSILEGLCGSENVAGVQPSQFHNGFMRAHLHNKLANIISELLQGAILADAELKSITSGELTTVEHKFKDPFQIRPYATCWFGTNHMPHTRDFSDGSFRRAVILTFNRVFKTVEQDPLLSKKLKAELPGILLLALNAYAQAIRRGFTEPSSTAEAKEQWRLEADQVAQFVEECCERPPEGSEPIGSLYIMYEAWAKEERIARLLGKKGFRDRLTGLGFGSDRNNDARLVTGIKVWGDYKPSL